MSYEAETHQVKMQILRYLLLVPSANFASLQKDTGLPSDHFNFHLQALVDADYVTKHENGNYMLSRAGKEYANRMDTDENVIEKQPKISVALIIENGSGKFLAQQRLKQPYYGFWGRPTGKIRWGESFEAAAARELLEETGLTADLQIAGFYHKMDYVKGTDDLLEDKLFVLIYGTNPEGELIVDGEGFHNEWLNDTEFDSKDTVFESVVELTKLARRNSSEFLEKRYEYDSTEY